MDSRVSDNLIQLLPDVDDEADCNHYCRLNSKCTYYTFYKSTSNLIFGACLLLSRLDKPFRHCNNCMTGAADCSQKHGICLFSFDGKLVDRVQISLASSQTVAPIPLGACGDVHVLAVGGGGKGGGRVQDGGGGSGYIMWATVPDSLAWNRKLLVEVGGGQRALMVTLWYKEVLVKAQPGETGTYYGGGAGYSGGGGGYYGCCDSGHGGTAAGNGQNSTNYPGGVGSGLNINSISVKGFTLR